MQTCENYSIKESRRLAPRAPGTTSAGRVQFGSETGPVSTSLECQISWWYTRVGTEEGGVTAALLAQSLFSFVVHQS